MIISNRPSPYGIKQYNLFITLHSIIFQITTKILYVMFCTTIKFIRLDKHFYKNLQEN